MYKRFIVGGMMLFSANLCALSCSTPVTISDSFLDERNISSHLFVNDQGDAAIAWCSTQPKREALTIAYKVQDTLWSIPVCISRWEKYISTPTGFIDSKGDICVIWSGKGNSIYKVEKNLGEPWSMPVTIENNSYKDYSCQQDHFDSFGQVTSIYKGEIKYTTKPSYRGGRTYEKTKPCIALVVQSADGQKIQDEFEMEEGTHGVYYLSMVLNKQGIGYIFWLNSKLDEMAIMCRKIQNNRFVSEPEVIAQKAGISPLTGTINERGDVALIYGDKKDHQKIVAKFQDSWCEPLLLATADENPRLGSSISIDNEGNIMAVCKTEIAEVDQLKVVYKPFGKSKMLSALFSVSDRYTRIEEVGSDGKGNFVMIWEEKQCRRPAIYGATFSTVDKTWSTPQQLSPGGEPCSDFEFKFWGPGKGYITWWTNPNGFDCSLQVAELVN